MSIKIIALDEEFRILKFLIATTFFSHFLNQAVDMRFYLSCKSDKYSNLKSRRDSQNNFF